MCTDILFKVWIALYIWSLTVNLGASSLWSSIQSLTSFFHSICMSFLRHLHWYKIARMLLVSFDRRSLRVHSMNRITDYCNRSVWFPCRTSSRPSPRPPSSPLTTPWSSPSRTTATGGSSSKWQSTVMKRLETCYSRVHCLISQWVTNNTQNPIIINAWKMPDSSLLGVGMSNENWAYPA